MRSSEKVKTHFDFFSTRYQDNYSQIKSGKTHEFRTRLQLVVNSTSLDSGDLLDCACGSGEITSQVLASGRFTKAVLSDISGAMLHIAKAKTAATPPPTALLYQEIDIFKFNPDFDLKFDVILCLGLIAHVGSLEGLLLHLKSMLKIGGKIVLQSSLTNHWGIKFTRLLTSKIFKKKHGYDLSYFSLKDIESHVRSSGLKINCFHRYNFGLPFGDRLTRTGNYWLEILMERFSAKYGSDAIFIITNKDAAASK